MSAEDAFIARLRAELPGRDSPAGIGDDGAVLRPGDGRVIVTDAMVEGVHFRRRWASVADVAYKSIAVNVSDVWAMGAEPTAWLLTIGIPPKDASSEIAAAWVSGASAAFEVLGVRPALVGGDTVRAPAGGLFASVTVVGRVNDTPWCRDGAHVGDTLWVNGPLGHAAAGLALLDAGVETNSATARAVHAQLRPTPSRPSVHGPVHAALDVSDGLARDALRMATASGVALELSPPPTCDVLNAAAAVLGCDPAPWVLHGGEDYVCLLAAPSAPGSNWTPVGRVVEGPPALTLLGPDGSREPLEPEGFEHFDSADDGR